MGSKLMIATATMALVLAMLVAAGELGGGLPDWLRGMLIGLGAAVAVNSTVVAAEASAQERQDERDRVRR